MVKMVHVKAHNWKKGKNGRHPSYDRKVRPKGKKKIKGKKVTKSIRIRDEYGRVIGTRTIK